MKFSNKNLLILLGVLVIVFVAIQLTKQTGRSKSLRSELVSIDTALVTKMVITSAKGELELNEANEGWLVKSGDLTKPTKENIVESMLSNLNTIKPGRLAARKEEKWKDYSVDSTGTRVQVFGQDDELLDIVLGRFGVEGQRSFHTFVRLTDEQNVYVANDFMKMSIYEEAKDYRNDQLLQLKKDSLVSVTVDYLDSAFALVRNDGWYVGNQPADSASVATYLQGLSYVSSKSFYDQSVDGNPTYSVTFSFSNQPDVVVDGFVLDGDVIIKSSENEMEVFRDQTMADKIFRGKGVFTATQ